MQEILTEGALLDEVEEKQRQFNEAKNILSTIDWYYVRQLDD